MIVVWQDARHQGNSKESSSRHSSMDKEQCQVVVRGPDNREGLSVWHTVSDYTWNHQGTVTNADSLIPPKSYLTVDLFLLSSYL